MMNIDVKNKIVQLWDSILSKELLKDNSICNNEDFYNNFFDSGGDSITLMKFYFAVCKEFEVNFDMKDFFKHPSLEYVINQINCSHIPPEKNLLTIDKAPKKMFYPITKQQQSIYLASHSTKKTKAYIIPIAIELNDTFTTEGIKNVLHILLRRHRILRTSYHILDNDCVCVVHEADDIKVELNISQYYSKDKENILKATVKDLNLSHPPLFSATLFENELKEITLLLNVHHIVIDGMSISILAEEFIKIYNGNELPHIERDYIDYMVFQKDWVNTNSYKIQEEYWHNQIITHPTEPYIPFDCAKEDEDELGRVSLILHEKEMMELKKFALSMNMTVANICFAAFSLLCHKYSNTHEIVIGVPFANRNAATHQMVGVFVNTLLIKSNFYPDDTVESFLLRVKNAFDEAHHNQAFPLLSLKERIGHIDYNREFINTIFQYQNIDVTDEMQFNIFQLNISSPRVDLLMELVENNRHVDLSINYRKNRYYDNHMEKLADEYLGILKFMSTGLHLFLADYDGVSSKRKIDYINAQIVDIEMNAIIEDVWEDVIGSKPQKSDDFFSVGGDSLKAMRFIWGIKRMMRFELGMEDLINNSIYTDVSNFIATKINIISQDKGIEEMCSDIAVAPIQNAYSVSDQQKNLYAQCFSHGDSKRHHIMLSVKIEKSINEGDLLKAINILMARNDVLRASFKFLQGRLVMMIHEDIAPPLKLGKPDELGEPFNPLHPPLFRINAELNEAECILHLCIHHIISDGVTVSTLYNDLITLLHNENLNETVYQYKDYVVWQEAYRMSEQYRETGVFWKNMYDKWEEQYALPYDSGSNIKKNATSDSNKITRVLNKELFQKFNDEKSKSNYTVNVWILAAVCLSLHKHKKTNINALGIAVSGRSRKEWDAVGGFFSRIFSVPFELNSYWNRIELFEHIRKTLSAVLNNQEYNIQNLHVLGTSPHKLHFDMPPIVFVYHNQWISYNSENNVAPLPDFVEPAEHDLKIDVFSNEKTTIITITYDQTLYHANSIESFLDDIEKGLWGLINNVALSNIVQADGKKDESNHSIHDYINRLSHIWRKILLAEIKDNEYFIESGGDSLKAMEIIYEIYKEFRIELELKHIFAYPTIRSLAEFLLELEQSGEVMEDTLSPKDSQYKKILASATQMGVHAYQLQYPESTAYNMTAAFTFEFNKGE